MKKKRILVCPLDWGLGHATRCIPVIKEFISQGAEVIIAADKAPLELLRQEFPQLEFIVFPGVAVKYPSKGNLALTILSFLPKFINNLFKEYKYLNRLIDERRIDLVISDNRYGLFTKKIPCIFITHQINIHAKVVMYILKRINFWFIKEYTECWIPDNEGEANLSGNLSHGKDIPNNCFYIGPLSRFEKHDKTGEIKYDVLALISGPEDQRTVFENLIIEKLKDTNLKTLIVRALPGIKENKQALGNIEFKNHLPAKELEQAILSSKIIMARSGYSTIMDLAKLQRPAILIPTPGQTEQEYLAAYLKEKGFFYSVSQKNFEREKAFKEIKNFRIPSALQNDNLDSRVKNILKK